MKRKEKEIEVLQIKSLTTQNLLNLFVELSLYKLIFVV